MTQDDFRDSPGDESEPLGHISVGSWRDAWLLPTALDISGDRDVFAITLEANKTYRVAAVGAPPPGNGWGAGSTLLIDPYFTISAYNGAIVVGNQKNRGYNSFDNYDSLNSVVEFTPI